jgi:hypothetical protein
MSYLGRLAKRAWRGYMPRTYLGVWLSAAFMVCGMLIALTLFDPTGGWAFHVFFGPMMAFIAFQREARRLIRRRESASNRTLADHQS